MPRQRKQRLLEALDLGTDLTDEQSQLQLVLMDYANVFALGPNQLGTMGVVQHSINTMGSPPIWQPDCPFALRPIVNCMVSDMLQLRIVKPSHSPWASPGFQRMGALIFCVDYWQL